MKIIRDDKATSVYCFLDRSHRHFHIYAGKTVNGQWKNIRVEPNIIPNCISIDTFDTNTIIVGIPENLLQKGIVTSDLPIIVNLAQHKDAVLRIAEFIKWLEGKPVPYNIIKHGLEPLHREVIKTSIEAKKMLEAKVDEK